MKFTKLFEPMKIGQVEIPNRIVMIPLLEAKNLTKRYGIDGVPSMIVNGKYRTSGSLAGGHKGMLQVVDYLIKKEAKK